VLSGKASEWNREIETHANFSASGIGKPVHLAIGLFAPFARENLEILERRCVDGCKAKAAEYGARSVHALFAWDHDFGKVVTKSFEGAWFNTIHGQLASAAVDECGWKVSPHGGAGRDFREILIQAFSEAMSGWQEEPLPVSESGKLSTWFKDISKSVEAVLL
jgi:hypothetical protein